MPIQPPIPKSLTKAEWDKNKGVFAKIAGETGVGAAMTDVDNAYKAVAWAKFDAMQALPGAKLVSVVEAGEKDATAETGKVNTLRDSVKALRDLTAKTEATFKKSKTIPASPTKYVGKVSSDADAFWITLKLNSSYFIDSLKSFTDLKATLLERQRVGAAKLKPYIKTITDFGKEVLAAPTVATYIGDAAKGFHQAIHGLSAALAVQTDPKLVSFLVKWKPFAQDGFKPADDTQVKAKVVTVLKELTNLGPLLA